ncbi:SRPBCC family protein [Rudaeicoccus suwonensis]|uniref:Carbon monoxide dehydrogenase subunit G n=1 Tax=Rudaeicoccus suwonensis TaxID=657409 RepID=A0A561E703_9MICO|nr:SRPBCC family protein [Rudaeicoccus suwonensis]TWE11398.1 carbon monoxide dehydrogenase subunit G [Rudaeicoccus suwonensis]
MVNVTRSFPVRVDHERALNYLRDFGNATQWDPGTVSCDRIGDATAPVEIGSRWHNTSKLLFVTTELTYELREESPTRLLFVGTNKTATSYDDITVEPSGSGTSRVTYHAKVEFNGAAKLSDPLMALIFRKLAKETVAKLTATLEGLT